MWPAIAFSIRGKTWAEDMPVNLSQEELLTFYQLARIGDIMEIRRNPTFFEALY